MKRISNRDLRNKFDLINDVRVHIDSLGQHRAQVRVDGVECELRFRVESRWAIARPEGVPADVVEYPTTSNAGTFARGTKEEPSIFPKRKSKDRRPTLEAAGFFGWDNTKQLSEFERQHPIGTLVTANVIFRRPRDVAVEFENGLRGRLETGYCLDHEPFKKVRWLPLPKVGETVEVIIRQYNWRAKEVLVSMHSYRQDAHYCSYASGYRTGFDAKGSAFARLPWGK
jgi:hypothetical protein